MRHSSFFLLRVALCLAVLTPNNILPLTAAASTPREATTTALPATMLQAQPKTPRPLTPYVETVNETATQSTLAAKFATAAPVVDTPEPATPALNTGPVMFIENMGQLRLPEGLSAAEAPRFRAEGNGGSLFLAPAALWVQLMAPTAANDAAAENPPETPEHSATPPAPEPYLAVNLRLSWVGANPAPVVEGFERLETHISYFQSNDPNAWHADVPVWAGVRYVDLYPGFDLELAQAEGQWVWRLRAKPGADLTPTGPLAQVRLKVEGAEAVGLVGDPTEALLQVNTAAGNFTLPRLEVLDETGRALTAAELQAAGVGDVAVVEGDEVVAPFMALPTVGQGRGAGWQRAAPNLLAVVAHPAVAQTGNDPALFYSTYLGGSSTDQIYGMAVDAAGATYVTGETSSSDFVTTTGAYSTTFLGSGAAFVTKLAPDGQRAIYSTFLGEDSYSGYGIVVNSIGEAYVAVNGPITATPATSLTCTGTSFGAFAIKLNFLGSGLGYSACLGASATAQDIALDADNNAYIVGNTTNPNFVITPDAYGNYHGASDVFVVKLNPSGDTRIYASLFGGSNYDCLVLHCDVEVDANRNIYVVGDTGSLDFSGMSNPPGAGGTDGYIFKVAPDGITQTNDLIYAKYLGTGGLDYAASVAVDEMGNAYVVGDTNSPSFSTTIGAFQTTLNGSSDAFLAQFNASGSILYSTYLGGSGGESAYVVQVDSINKIYLSGGTSSANFPVSEGAFQSQPQSAWDSFVIHLNLTLPGKNALQTGTFLGGSSDDFAHSLVLGQNGIVYIGGLTSSPNFPTTHGVLQNNFRGGLYDGFITKMRLASLPPESIFTTFSNDPRECDCGAYGGASKAVAQPINPATGGFDHTFPDLSVPTLAGPLAFVRSYASLVTNTYTATLGYGWTHNQDTRLILPTSPGGEAGVVWFKSHSASTYRFDIQPVGTISTYLPYPGVLASLSAVGAGYVLTTSTQGVYTFDAAGRVVQWRNGEGYGFNYAYSPQGQLITLTEPLSQRYLALNYDGQGRITSVRDHTQRQVSYSYDPTTGDLVAAVDVLGQTWTYEYLANTHLLVEMKYPGGPRWVHTDFDAQGRAWRQFEGQNLTPTVELAYNLDGTIVITDIRGFTQTQRYNGRGTLSQNAAPLGQVITQSFDANFRPATVQDPLGHPTTMTWNATGSNPTQLTDALSQTARFGYDAFNNLTQVVDARTFTTTYTYSGTRLTSSTDAFSKTTLYTYTTAADGIAGLLKAITDPQGRTTRYQYDPLGQQVAMTNAAGLVTRWGYDLLGRVVTLTANAGSAQQTITLNQYDNAGRLVRVTRNYLAGQLQNYASGSGGSVYNQITRYQYDVVGNQTYLTDTLGLVTRTEYDDHNRPVTVTINYSPSASGPDYNLVTVKGYDGAGNVTRLTRNHGTAWARTTLTEYDALNRPVTVTENYSGTGAFNPAYPDWNIKAVTTYDVAGNVTATTQYVGSALARTTLIEYDVLNRPMTVTANYVPGQSGSDKNIKTVTGYDANGNVVTTTEFYGTAAARMAVTQYDALNRPVTVTSNYTGTGNFNPAFPDRNLKQVTAYNAAGQVVSVTTAYGSAQARTTFTEYDPKGRPVTTTTNYDGTGIPTPDRNVMQVTVYGPAGERAATVERRAQPDGTFMWITNTYGYNNLGQLVTTTQLLTNGVMAVTTQQYDALGRVVATTDALGMVSRTQYDALGRALTVTTNYTTVALTNPYNLQTITAYDIAGNQVKLTDAKGYATRYQYDARNRLITVVDALTGTTRYVYNVAGNLTVITDARSYPTTFTYDLLNRQTTEANALGHTTIYTYDVASNRTALRDAKGQVITFAYNLNNQLLFTNYPTPTADVSFRYNALGQTVAMTDGVGVTTWVYDGLGRPLTITSPLTGAVSYTYDSAGQRRSLRYPGGQVLNYHYDWAGRLVEVQGALLGVSYGYNALGQPLTVTVANGASTYYTYDTAHRLIGLASVSGVRPLARYVYTLDEVGNRLSVVEHLEGVPQPPLAPAPHRLYLPLVLRLSGPPTVQYTYDELHRLTKAQYATGAVFSYTYDAVGNRLSQQTPLTSVTYLYDNANRLASANGQTYTWDNNGNLLSDGGSTHSYDAANRLITTTQGANVFGFSYNGLGDRVRQTANGTPTVYAVDLAAGLTQVLADGTNTYWYGLGRVAQTGPTQTHYFLGDALGSVRQLVSITGLVALRRDYDPYGNVLSSAGTAGTAYGFTGEWTDNTGLVFLRARYYAPGVGRFISADTIGVRTMTPEASHRYVYGVNNPVRYVDPTGHFEEDEIRRYIEHRLKITDSVEREILLYKWGTDTNWWKVIRGAKVGDLLDGNRLLWGLPTGGRVHATFHQDLTNNTFVLSGWDGDEYRELSLADVQENVVDILWLHYENNQYVYKGGTDYASNNAPWRWDKRFEAVKELYIAEFQTSLSAVACIAPIVGPLKFLNDIPKLSDQWGKSFNADKEFVRSLDASWRLYAITHPNHNGLGDWLLNK